jgi:RNA polymerase sigma-70 factor, ECF subfamily
MPPGYRSVFMLREVEGLSTAETAACLDLSEDAVKVRLHRAKARLRADLDTSLGETAAALFGFDGLRCDRIVAAVMARLAAR